MVVKGKYNNNNSFGVRPAVVLDLNKDVWYNAGTVSSDGSKNEVSIEEQTDLSEPGEDKKPENSKESSPAPKDKANTYTVGAFSYTVRNNTATIAAPKSKTKKAVTIPATIKINGRSIPVTTIAPNAFKGMKNLTSITIGKNIKTIGKNAFKGCKKLKTITIKTTKLTAKTVGANAFKGINSKAKIKVPKKKLSAYKKILKKKGIGKKVKTTK